MWDTEGLRERRPAGGRVGRVWSDDDAKEPGPPPPRPRLRLGVGLVLLAALLFSICLCCVAANRATGLLDLEPDQLWWGARARG